MPELPEVESLRRSLLPFLLNQKILKVEVKLPKLVSSKGTKRVDDLGKKIEFEKGLEGKKILKIERKNKNLIFSLEGGGLMMVHLKMTGQLVYQGFDNDKPVIGGHPIEASEKSLPHKHTYVIFETEKGVLYYNDTRQFGYLLYFDSLDGFEKEEHFKHFGQEPLADDFDLKNFSKDLKIKSGVLKKVLLDGKVVVGVGNIYADEICFASRVLPTRKANSLSQKEIKAMYENTKQILAMAVAQGGSSVANYLLGDGSRGNYANYHKVYGRGGKPCLVCGSVLDKVVIGGRTSVFCKKCQK
jgi:formamidopyrimidine-DNA glycosylase